MKNKKTNTMIGEGRPVRTSVGHRLINNRITGFLAELIFLLMGVYGVLVEVQRGYFEELDYGSAVTYSFAIAVVILLVLNINKLWLYIVSLIAGIVLAIYNYTLLADGAYCFYINACRWISWYLFEDNISIPAEILYAPIEVYETALLVAVLPWIIFSSLSWRRKGGLYGGIFAMSLYMTLFFCSGYMPDFVPMFFSTASVCALVFRHMGYSKEDNKRNYVQLYSYVLLMAIGFCMAFLLVEVTTSKVLPVQDYIYRHYTLDKVVAPENDKDADKVDPSGKGEKKQADGGISGGKTGKGGKEFDPKGDETLKLYFSERVDHTIYLRGYVADTYTGNEWINTADMDATFYYTSSPYSILTMEYSNIQKALSENSLLQYSGINSLDVTISGLSKDVGENGYVLTPYAGIVSSEDGILGDGYYIVRGRNQDTVNYYTFYDFEGGYDPGEKKGFFDILCKEGRNVNCYLDSFSKKMVEEQYEYAADNYLDVPEFLADIKEEYSKVKWTDLKEAVLFVRNELSDGFYYTTKPKATPEGEDFIHYFLYESKEGYCMYYASAATMIFRSMGIPARYVEGYVLPKAAANVNIYVKDTNAHAWVEIFVEGYGWIPVEVTNGRITSRGVVSDNQKETTTPQETTKKPEKETTKPSQPSTNTDNEEPVDNINAGRILIRIILVLAAVILGYYFVKLLIYGGYALFYKARLSLGYRKRLLKIYKHIYKMTRRTDSPFVAEGDAETIAAGWNININTVEKLQESLMAAEFGRRGITAEECRLAEKMEEHIMRIRAEKAGAFSKLINKRIMRIRRKINAGK